jgi:hypothetical protein
VSRPQQLDDLRLVRVATFGLFREDRASVGLDIEDAAATRDELRLDPELLLDRGRETRGPRLVASLNAVRDPDARHDENLPGSDPAGIRLRPVHGSRLVGNRFALAGTVLYFMEWVGIVLAPSLPTDKLGRDPASILSAYADRPGWTAFLAGWLSVVLVGRVLYVAALRSAFRDSGYASTLLDVALGAMSISVAIEIVSYDVVGAGAWLADRHAGAATVAALDAASTVLFLTIFGPLAVSVVAASIPMVTSRLFPRWLAWLGVVTGVLLVVAGIIGASAQGASGGFHDLGGVLGSVPVAGVWLWMIATSVLLFRRAPRSS